MSVGTPDRDTTYAKLFAQATESSAQSASSGQTIDRSGHDGVLLVIDVTGYTDGTTTFEMITSDDDASFSAASDDLIAGDSEPVIDGAGKTGTYYLAYRGSEPFVGFQTTVSGTTTGCTYSVQAFATDKARAPKGSTI